MGSVCSYCTLWADGFNGVVNHLNDAFAFVVVTPDTVETMNEFAQSRNWKLTMVSSNGTTFFEEMGFAHKKDDKLYYTPGYSVFIKNEDDTISRVSMDYFGPMDSYSSIWHIINFIPNFGKWYPKKAY